MHWLISDPRRSPRFRSWVVALLIIAQCLLLQYMLTLDFVSTLFIGMLFGAPIAYICYLSMQKDLPVLHMIMIMIAAGSFGMLFGCFIEHGPLGLYGLLALCQTGPLVSSPLDIVGMWQRIMLSPGIYVGMLIACNLSMVLFTSSRHGLGINSILYVFCNLGMLFGMVISESFTVSWLASIGSEINVTMMLMSMVVGMFLGLVLAWGLAQYVYRLSSRMAKQYTPC